MKKQEIFAKQLSYIKNEIYKESVENLLELVPDYFFEIPASSTGKYHPAFSLGDRGLVRHTKVAVEIANEMLGLESLKNVYTNDERDLMICALIFHDCIKSGFEKSKYTKVDHPLLACQFIEDNKDKTKFSEKDISFMKKVIASHMGEWNKDYQGNEVLPKPNDKYEIFVHVCDYLASRKFLDIKFVDDDILKE